MLRWERQKEVFELLDYNGSMTVRELSDELDIEINHADFLLRHYNKNGYLTRYKDVSNDNRYAYQLSEKGSNQLKDFLENNEYLNYLEIY